MQGRLALLPLLLICAAIPCAAQGPGDLGVTPTRLVFAGRDRTAQVTLINRAATEATYRIGFLHLRMDGNGQLAEITEPGPEERFAGDLLRFSPRQVTLAPGATQTVRLLLRKPDGLPAGEYRSHLVFQSVPAEGGTDVEALDAPAQGIEVRLIPIFRIAIPVLVRHGELAAEARLDGLAVSSPATAEAPPRISFLLHRTGDRSLHGDLTATFVPDAGQEIEAARVKGLALYAPSVARRVDLALALPPGVDLRAGRLRVRFEEEKGTGSRPASAQAEISLP